MDKQPRKHANEESELAARLRQWQQANPEATFTDMENAVDAEMTRLRRELLRELTAAAETATPPECPECKQSMVRNGRKKRRVRTKDNSMVEMQREQWRCLQCGMTLFPPG